MDFHLKTTAPNKSGNVPNPIQCEFVPNRRKCNVSIYYLLMNMTDVTSYNPEHKLECECDRECEREPIA